MELWGARAQSEGLGDGVPRRGSGAEPQWGSVTRSLPEAEAYTTINFANTWKDMAPLKLFHFGEFKIAVYAFQQLHTLTLGQGHSK